jgi:hypothetical protein
MRRSSIRSRIGAATLASLGTLLASNAFAQIGGAGPTRFVDIVEVTDHDDQVDLTVQFNCSVRYITHLPASEGSEAARSS